MNKNRRKRLSVVLQKIDRLGTNIDKIVYDLQDILN
jgi:translation elongation factor EF-G